MKKNKLFWVVGFSAVFVSASYGEAYEPPATAVSKINSYRGYSELTKAAGGMDIDQYTYNMTTWQIANGGFYKAMAEKYKNAYTGGEKSDWRAIGNQDLATIDNNATIQEMRLLAIRYKETTNSNYKNAFKESFNKAVNFLLSMQRSKGGLPQVWPKRGNYSDQITLNDNAMIRAMVTMMDIANKTSPFDSDIINDATRSKMRSAMDRAIDFLLNAQIKNDGNLTVWCAQHDTNSYTPVGGRAYELPSKSGNESMGVVWFLMNWPNQTSEIQKAVKGAIAWYKKNKLSNKAFSKTAGVIDKNGSSLWFRFYEVDNDNYFFCDRDGASTKTQDFMQISEERRTGYQWAGDYGSAILGTEEAYLKSLEKMNETYVETTPENMCGEVNCVASIDGVNFINIQGVKETTNTGYLGEGYANVDNTTNSYVTYGVTAMAEGKYTLYVRFANGSNSARDYSIVAIDEAEYAKGSMEATGSWSTWKVNAIKVTLPKGYSELKFTSLSKDGMANIDMIGWTSDNLKTGKIDILEEPGSDAILKHPQTTKNKTTHRMVFGNMGKGAGIFYLLNSKDSTGKHRKVRIDGR